MLVGENEPFYSSLLPLPVLEYAQSFIIQRDYPGLGVLSGLRSDGHCSQARIEVAPLQIEDLTAPEAAIQRQQDNRR